MINIEAPMASSGVSFAGAAKRRFRCSRIHSMTRIEMESTNLKRTLLPTRRR